MVDLVSGQLKLYSSVSESTVDWLWYPYIPFGKITLLQGDPGCGKSTLMMSIIASLSTGKYTPDGQRQKKPLHVIYQCSEDSISDTIKPRLTAAGADCSNVAFLEEETDWLTIDDDRIRRAIADFNAKLLVIDPVQAYLGDADISSISGMRRVLRQLALWASMYDCAIVLVGHLNKRQGAKELYRSLGSIDLIASARSVIQIEPYSVMPEVAVLHHIKSSLSMKGKDMFFRINEKHSIQWLDPEDIAALIDGEIQYDYSRMNKQAQAAELLRTILVGGPMRVSDVQALFREKHISEKTIYLAKKTLGIQSTRKDGAWYWQISENKDCEQRENR